jgi:hypothetical protein
MASSLSSWFDGCGVIMRGLSPGRLKVPMPEGDTIAYAAKRLRPVLEGHVPDEIRTPQRRHAMDRWPERLGGRVITEITTHGKHLFVHFEGELTLHSHLRMTGAWGVYTPGRRPRRSMRRAWLVLRRGSTEVVEFDGPVLELLTESRARLDRRLAGLGPDVLADEFDYARQGGLLGVRGEMGALGFGSTLSMTIQLNQFDRRTESFVPVQGSTATRTETLGPLSTGVHQGGAEFHYSSDTGLLDATVTFTWTRDGHRLGEVTRTTTSGHRTAAFAEPVGHSTASCRL